MLLTLGAGVNAAYKDKCQAIVLSGGAAHGAYEAGVMWGMYNTLQDKTQMEYDVVTGVSAGSINAYATVLHAIGKEGDLVEWMFNQWSTLTSSDVYKEWNCEIIDALLVKSGILDDSPLANYLYNVG
jgi:predicted acylesterase/phospholipase RssA